MVNLATSGGSVEIILGISYKSKQKASTAESKAVEDSSDSESAGLLIQHAMTSCLGKAAWIIDSGATCHMCNERSAMKR